MNAISATASSIDAVNQILQMANQKNTEAATKLMKFTVETALAGKESGKGGGVDMVA